MSCFLQACLRWKKQPICVPPPGPPNMISISFIIATSKSVQYVRTLIDHWEIATIWLNTCQYTSLHFDIIRAYRMARKNLWNDHISWKRVRCAVKSRTHKYIQTWGLQHSDESWIPKNHDSTWVFSNNRIRECHADLKKWAFDVWHLIKVRCIFNCGYCTPKVQLSPSIANVDNGRIVLNTTPAWRVFLVNFCSACVMHLFQKPCHLRNSQNWDANLHLLLDIPRLFGPLHRNVRRILLLRFNNFNNLWDRLKILLPLPLIQFSIDVGPQIGINPKPKWGPGFGIRLNSYVENLSIFGFRSSHRGRVTFST